MDWEEKGTFSKRPYYALRESYFDIIYKAGGLPLAIPYITDAIDDYLGRISALVVPGGDFALCKDWYTNPDEEKPWPPSKRLDFDVAIVKKALDKNMPFLGICAGMQVMGGVSGAKMTPNINRYLGTSIDHRNHCPPDQFAHEVIVEQESLLYKITGKSTFPVNTAHSEAIIATSQKLLVSAKAADGGIEAIERKDKDFVIGLQWHPEFFLDDDNPGLLIFKALIAKAGEKS